MVSPHHHGLQKRFADAFAGVAPYSGLVAVTANSRTLTDETTSQDGAYDTVQRRCEIIGKHCRALAPMRIDARRRNGSTGDFVIFDVNSKPVSALASKIKKYETSR